MLNQVVVVGRLIETPILEETKSGKKTCTITIAVQRSFKDEEGVYHTDIISCNLVGGLAENTCEYCTKGDFIAVRGRLARLSNEMELQIVADKITFLSKKEVEE